MPRMIEMRVPGSPPMEGRVEDLAVPMSKFAGTLRMDVMAGMPKSPNVEVQTRAQAARAAQTAMKSSLEQFKNTVARAGKRDLGYQADPKYAKLEKIITEPVVTEPRNKKADQIDTDAERAAVRELGLPITDMKKQDKLSVAERIYDKESRDYDTKLTAEDEKKFLAWKKEYAPKDSGYDYDLRGAFKAGLKPNPKSGHWPDTYKKPNHPTFSNESKYAKDRPDLAGHWEGDKYIPPKKKK